MKKTIRECVICELGLNMETSTATDLAKRVGYTPATVSSLLRKMHVQSQSLVAQVKNVGPKGGAGYKLTGWGKLTYLGIRLSEGLDNVANALKDAFHKDDT